MDSPMGFRPAFSLFVLVILCPLVVQGTGLFRANRRLGAAPTVADILRHDEQRIAYLMRHDEQSHSRRLSTRAVDVPIGGALGKFMWYADILIGTPPQHFQVQLDTGSPALWVDCEGCDTCMKSGEGVKLETYNPKLSKTARIVMGEDSLCGKQNSSAKNSSSGTCDFSAEYEDGTGMYGYYVTDLVSFNQVSSNPTSGLANITFGCANMKTGPKGNPLVTGVEGLIGLSATKNSYLVQMASLGKVRKEFAHCFHTEGGIFAIGHVVKPKVTTMIPLLPWGYNVYDIKLTAIEVGVHSHIHNYRAIVDTGSYFISLPKAAYDFIIEKIFLKHPNLNKVPDESQYLHFPKSVADELPTISFQFNTSNALKVDPHDYLIPEDGDQFFFGLKSSGNNFILIGDFAMRNKLFIYDLENYQIGWQDYDCSSSIEVEDEDGVCNIGAHNVKSQSLIEKGVPGD